MRAECSSDELSASSTPGPGELVPKIAPRPVFFIHAGADDAGHLGPVYFHAAKEPKQIWEAQGGHTDGIDKEPEEYERRVTAFFEAALLP